MKSGKNGCQHRHYASSYAKRICRKRNDDVFVRWEYGRTKPLPYIFLEILWLLVDGQNKIGTFLFRRKLLIICWASIVRKILLRPWKVSQIWVTTRQPCTMAIFSVVRIGNVLLHAITADIYSLIFQKLCFLHFTMKNYFMSLHVLWWWFVYVVCQGSLCLSRLAGRALQCLPSPSGSPHGTHNGRVWSQTPWQLTSTVKEREREGVSGLCESFSTEKSLGSTDVSTLMQFW